EKEIEFTEEEWDSSLYYIKRDLSLSLAYNKWGTKGRYQVLIPKDEHIQTSIAILKKVKVPSDLYAYLL
ncbi:hypothetical protein KAT89_05995, partial [candidate division WOR-3 bacterium]|nr:hypothetical protein [candidate division WOR-3 bacterium]